MPSSVAELRASIARKNVEAKQLSSSISELQSSAATKSILSSTTASSEGLGSAEFAIQDLVTTGERSYESMEYSDDFLIENLELECMIEEEEEEEE
jgi:hypothetical protein